MLVLKQLPPFHAFPGLPGQDWVSVIFKVNFPPSVHLICIIPHKPTQSLA